MAGGNLSLLDGLCRTYILQRMDNEDANGVSSRLYNGLMTRYEEEMRKRDSSGVADHAESLARAWADMKNTIEEAYENGTREVWTMEKNVDEDFSGVEFEIDGNAVRYRKLSMEEELGKLEQAFDVLTEDIAAELVEKKNAEYAASGEEMTDGEKEFWTLADFTDGLVREIDHFLKLIAQEEAAKKKEEPLDPGARLAEERRNYGAETAARGRRQAQYANYKKMSRMAADIQTLLGNVRA